MICPSCKCEYLRGVTQCPDCDVALVDALAPEQPAIPENSRIVAIWRGADPVECEKVASALADADIPYTKANSKSLFGSRPNESTLELWVSEADQEKAGEVVGSLEDLPEELSPEQAPELFLPESDQPDEDDQSLEDLSEKWHEDDAASDVWSGDSELFADNLMMCLREIGIASRKLSEDGGWRVVVRPDQETRAKEIVREMVEASPPK